jgi:hypothetical protein
LQGINVPLELGGIIISTANNFKSSTTPNTFKNLSWNNHVNNITKKANSTLINVPLELGGISFSFDGPI